MVKGERAYATMYGTCPAAILLNIRVWLRRRDLISEKVHLLVSAKTLEQVHKIAAKS